MSVSPQERGQRGLTWWGALAVAAVTLVAFLGTLGYGFVDWDDPIEVLNNKHIEGLSGENISWMFSNFDYVRRYQPLDWLSWAINYHFGERNAFGYHLGNVVQQVISAVLLYFLLLKLLRVMLKGWGEDARKAMGAGIPVVCAALGALIWAVHPLRAECVAWVTGRIYTQCAMFLFGCLLCYVYSTDKTIGVGRRRWLYAASLIMFVCSLLSYATVVGAAVVLVLLDIYPLGRFEVGGRNRYVGKQAMWVWLGKAPFLAAALAVGIVTLVARANAHGLWEPPPTLQQFSLFARAMQAFYSWAYYAVAPFAPTHLLPVYTRLVHLHPNELVFWVSAVFVMGMTVVSAMLWRRWKWVGVVWGSHLAMLLPYVGLTETPHYTNDRYAHFQGIVFAALVAGGLLALYRRFGMQLFRGTVAVLVVTVMGLGMLGYFHSEMWRDSETYFKTMIAELGDDPYRGDIYWRLGVEYGKQGRVVEALTAYDASLQLMPRNSIALRNMGELLLKMAKTMQQNGAPADRVKAQFLVAGTTLAQIPKAKPSDLDSAGYALGEAGLTAAAVEALKQATALSPGEASYHLHYGKVLFVSGARDEAMREVGEAERLSPELAVGREKMLAEWREEAGGAGTQR